MENEYSVNKENFKFHFTPVDTRQVEKVFGKFKSSMGSGPDGIANFFLKAERPILAESLCDIFNLSLSLKLQPYLSSLFLPIVLEELVYNQLYEYFDENKHKLYLGSFIPTMSS